MAGLLSIHQDNTTAVGAAEIIQTNLLSSNQSQCLERPTTKVDSVDIFPKPICDDLDEDMIQMMQAEISKIFKDELRPFQPLLWINQLREVDKSVNLTVPAIQTDDNGNVRASFDTVDATDSLKTTDFVVTLMQLDSMLFPDSQKFDAKLKLRYYSYLVQSFDIDCNSFPDILTMVGETEWLIKCMRNFLQACAVAKIHVLDKKE